MMTSRFGNDLDDHHILLETPLLEMLLFSVFLFQLILWFKFNIKNHWSRPTLYHQNVEARVPCRGPRGRRNSWHV